MCITFKWRLHFLLFPIENNTTYNGSGKEVIIFGKQQKVYIDSEVFVIQIWTWCRKELFHQIAMKIHNFWGRIIFVVNLSKHTEKKN